MAIFKITYSDRFKRANVYNYGCNYDCNWCSYKLNGIEKPQEFLCIAKVKKILSELDVERVHFLGGEPTTNPDLSEIADFAHNELGAYTKLGHSNGSNPPPPNIDASSVSIKTYTDRIHLEHIGVSNAAVLRNFKDAYKRGIEMDASSVYIPGLIECDEIEKVVKFIADIDTNIPYYIVGYVPVPGAPWRSPTHHEMKDAEAVARSHLKYVTSSCLIGDDFLNLKVNDIRYQSIRVA